MNVMHDHGFLLEALKTRQKTLSQRSDSLKRHLERFRMQLTEANQYEIEIAKVLPQIVVLNKKNIICFCDICNAYTSLYFSYALFRLNSKKS